MISIGPKTGRKKKENITRHFHTNGFVGQHQTILPGARNTMEEADM